HYKSFNHVPPTTHTHTLSLHDALPIYQAQGQLHDANPGDGGGLQGRHVVGHQARRKAEHALVAVRSAQPPGMHAVPAAHVERVEDRKSTRLNSSHDQISYAVFCLKKKK